MRLTQTCFFAALSFLLTAYTDSEPEVPLEILPYSSSHPEALFYFAPFSIGSGFPADSSPLCRKKWEKVSRLDLRRFANVLRQRKLEVVAVTSPFELLKELTRTVSTPCDDRPFPELESDMARLETFCPQAVGETGKNGLWNHYGRIPDFGRNDYYSQWRFREGPYQKCLQSFLNIRGRLPHLSRLDAPTRAVRDPAVLNSRYFEVEQGEVAEASLREGLEALLQLSKLNGEMDPRVAPFSRVVWDNAPPLRPFAAKALKQYLEQVGRKAAVEDWLAYHIMKRDMGSLMRLIPSAKADNPTRCRVYYYEAWGRHLEGKTQKARKILRGLAQLPGGSCNEAAWFSAQRLSSGVGVEPAFVFSGYVFLRGLQVYDPREVAQIRPRKHRGFVINLPRIYSEGNFRNKVSSEHHWAEAVQHSEWVQLCTLNTGEYAKRGCSALSRSTIFEPPIRMQEGARSGANAFRFILPSELANTGLTVERLPL